MIVKSDTTLHSESEMIQIFESNSLPSSILIIIVSVF